MDGAVLLDVDGGAGLLLDAANHLAAGTDDVADLVHGDLDGLDARRGLLHLGTRAVDGVQHGGQDEGAALVGLLQGAGQNLDGQALGLVVHLQGGDAVRGAADLEVHIAEEVLDALDVGEDDHVVALLDEAHGHTGDGRGDRHAGVHQGQAASARGGHGGGAVGLEHLGDHADGVGEGVGVGQHGHQCALGQGAVAHLAALRRPHATGLAGAVGREVVLVHVALALFGPDGVEALPLVEHSQGAHGHDLGLAALEQARAVHAGQIPRHDVQRADLLGGAAVDALAGLKDHGAHGPLLEGLEGRLDVGAPGSALLLGEVVLDDGGLELFHLLHAGGLVGVLEGRGHLVEMRVDALGHRRVGGVDGVVHGGGVHLGEEGGLLLAEGGDGLLAEGHGGQHVLLGDLGSAGLDHGDVVGGAGDGELQIGVLLLGDRGVHDELAGLDVAAYANAGSRAVEGRAAHEQGRGGAGHADGVGQVLAVDDERGGHDVHLVLVAIREARADGAVHHAGHERAVVGRLRLALQVAAGDAAHGVHLLDVVHREREEVVVLLLAGDDGGHEHARGTAGHEHSAGGLLGQLAGLEAVLLAVQLEFFDNFRHNAFLSLQLPRLIAEDFFGRGYLHSPPPRPSAPHALPTAYSRKRGPRRGPVHARARCCRGYRAS